MNKTVSKIFDYYSDFKSLKDLKKEKFKHMFLLLYWPIYGLAFLILERFANVTYHPVESSFDSIIPFCEFFVVPYYFWFPFMFWIVFYGFFFDIPTFTKDSIFITITYSITVLVYIFYPTVQNLRPTEFVRDNIFVDVVRALYAFDTSTNVCPSIHVIGSLSTLFSAWHSKRYSTIGWRIAFVVMTVIICISTVFLKQHSLIDVLCGILVSFIVYPFVFHRKKKKTKEKVKPTNGM